MSTYTGTLFNGNKVNLRVLIHNLGNGYESYVIVRDGKRAKTGSVKVNHTAEELEKYCKENGIYFAHKA